MDSPLLGVSSWISFANSRGLPNLPPVGCESELGGTEALVLSAARGKWKQGLPLYWRLLWGLMAAGGSVMGRGEEGKVSEPLWWLGSSGQRKAGRVRGWLELEKGAFFFFKYLFLTEGLLLHNSVLVSTTEQHESTICVHMSIPSWTSLLPPTPLGCYRAPVWVSWVI